MAVWSLRCALVLSFVAGAKTLAVEIYDGFGDPTPREILLLEYINRARQDAVAEAERLRDLDDFWVQTSVLSFNVDLDLMAQQFAALDRTVPPLAMNARLLAAARSHSQDMFNNTFQDHLSSSNPVPPNQPGDSFSMRISRQGYDAASAAENLAAAARSPWFAHAKFNISWGYGPGGMWSPASGRLRIHDPAYKEAGIGIVEEYSTAGSITVGPFVVTENFAVEAGNAGPFLCGVTYVDRDADAFYSFGEGLGAVSIEVDGAAFSALSSTHGAYALPLPGDGFYTVTFRCDGYVPVSTGFTVSGGQNVKIDYPAIVAVGPVTLLEASLSGTTHFFLRVHYNGWPSELRLKTSGDLTTWTDLPTGIYSIGGGEFWFEFPIGGDPFFARIAAEP